MIQRLSVSLTVDKKYMLLRENLRRFLSTKKTNLRMIILSIMRFFFEEIVIRVKITDFADKSNVSLSNI